MAINRLIFYVNGVLTNPTSVNTGDSGGTWGFRDVETLTTVTAAALAYTNVSTGYYEYDFVEEEDDIQYEWAVKVVYSGTTYYFTGVMLTDTNTTVVVLPEVASHYSSQAEVLRIMGSHAGDLLLEDAASKTSVWSNLLTDADETIKMYVMQHYDPDNLYTVNWVRRRATMLVANLLSGRRGSPPVYSSSVDRVYEELNMIRDGRMRIPGATIRYFQGPIVRNYQMQSFWEHPMRVENSKSTKVNNYAGEDIALEPYFYFGPLGV